MCPLPALFKFVMLSRLNFSVFVSGEYDPRIVG
jgi:hypothetical protein